MQCVRVACLHVYVWLRACVAVSRSTAREHVLLVHRGFKVNAVKLPSPCPASAATENVVQLKWEKGQSEECTNDERCSGISLFC